MTSALPANYLATLEAAVNANQLDLARQKLAAIALMDQNTGRLFELAAIVELKSGQAAQAAPYLEKGVTCPDASFFCYYLLGSLYLSQNNFQAAADKLNVAVNKGARFFECFYNLGMAQLQLSQNESGLKSMEAALALNAQFPNAWHAKGVFLQNLAKVDEAERAFLHALKLAPHLVEAQTSLGYLYHAQGKKAQALPLMKSALAATQDERQKEHLAYLLASLGDEATPDRAPDHYVKDLFDKYAANFEADLVQKLKYKVPQLLHERLSQLMPHPWASVLDLGCGTGLWGKLIRGQCQHLVGMDISAKMIEQAQTLQIYDELHCAEIVAFTEATSTTFDLVVAADVFVYFGNLAEVFAATHQCMRENGVFCFSVELLAETPAPAEFALTTTGRYAHTDAYIRQLALQSGYKLLDSFEGVGREERGQPVRSGIYFLQREA